MTNRIFSFYDSFDRMRFTDVFPDEETFLAAIAESKIPLRFAQDDTASTIYYLLYAKYGNDLIAANDTLRFKYDLFRILFSYAPKWEKELEIQSRLRGLTIQELQLGKTEIYNHSYNPSTAPSTSTLEELTTINDQNVSKHKRSAIEAYSVLASLLDDTFTEKFLSRFERLFLKLLAPTEPLLYDVTELQENIMTYGGNN